MKNLSISKNQLLNGTILFGISQILISGFLVIRAKIIAENLGPTGIGDFGLLSGLMILLLTFFQLGVDRSSVKAIVIGSTEMLNLKNKTSALNSLTLIISFFSIIVVYVFSHKIGLLTFGDYNHNIDVTIIALTLPFMILTSVYHSILRGIKETKILVKCMIIGNGIGVLLSIPIILYNSIFNFSLILFIPAFTNYLISLFYTRKLNINLKFSLTNLTKEKKWLKTIIKEGITIVFSGLFFFFGAYILKIEIAKTDNGIVILGFYVAAFSILNNYFGSLFSAITMDYYPRIVEVINNKKLYIKAVNFQTEISIYFLLPLILILHRFSHLFIKFLYSEEFLLISDLITVGCVAVFFKTLTYGIGVSFMAKGHVKLLAVTEFINNIILLLGSLLCYQYFGLIGLGYAYLISNLYQLLQTFLLCYLLYGYRTSLSIVIVVILSFLIVVFSTLIQLNYISNNLFLNIFIYLIPILVCAIQFFKILKSKK